MFSILTPDDVLKHWSTIQPMLQSWVDMEPNGEYSTKDLLEEAMGGKRDFWILFSVKDGQFKIDVVLSTYITSTPLKRVWFWHLAIGEGLLASMEEVQRTFEGQARLYGCQALQMVARRGFGKALAKYEWKQLSTIFEHRLIEKDGHHGGSQDQYQPAGNVAGSVGDEHSRIN